MCRILVLELRNVVLAIMDPNKCFLIFIVILHTSLNYSAEGSSKQNIYKKVFFNADHNECVCFEQNQNLVTVPQHLDPQNEEIVRLIIILYRTKNGSIYTYIPNRIKQSVLPDLQYEADDTIINNSNEQFDQLFLNSDKSIKYPLQSVYLPVKKNDSFSIPMIEPVKIDKRPNCKNQNKIKDTEEFSVACKPDKDLEGIQSKNISYNVQPNLPNVKQIPDVNQIPNINQRPDVKQIPNIKQRPDVKQIPNIKQIQNVKEIPNEKGTNVKNYSSTIILSPLKNNKQNQMNNLDLFNPNKILKYNYSVNQTLPEGSFNKWFSDQMKNLETGHSLHQPLNFGAVEQLILAALKDHGMLVSANGVLTDRRGNVFNITNLYLRPLLIGESIKYDSVKANPNGSYALPDVSSYMESVLIAVLDPPKVVAVIPIGKVKVPKTLDFRHVYRSEQLTNHHESNFTVKLLSYDKDMSPTLKFSLNNIYEPSTSSKNVLTSMDNIFETEDNLLKPIDNERIISKFHVKVNPGVIHDDPKGLKKEHITVLPYEQPVKMNKTPKSLEKKLSEKNPYYMHPAFTYIKGDYDSDEYNEHHDFRVLGGKRVTGSDMKKISIVPYAYPKATRKEPKGVVTKRNTKKKPSSMHIKPTPIEVNYDGDDDDYDYHGSDIPGRISVTESGAVRKRTSPIETHIKPIDVGKRPNANVNTAPTPIEIDYDSDGGDDENNDDGNDDYLDFRIIGGAAATGSGIPISNRGRSGKLSF